MGCIPIPMGWAPIGLGIMPVGDMGDIGDIGIPVCCMPIGMPMGGWVDMPPMDVGVIGPMVVGVEGAVSEGELGGPIVDGEGTPEGDIIPTGWPWAMGPPDVGMARPRTGWPRIGAAPPEPRRYVVIIGFIAPPGGAPAGMPPCEYMPTPGPMDEGIPPTMPGPPPMPPPTMPPITPGMGPPPTWPTEGGICPPPGPIWAA